MFRKKVNPEAEALARAKATRIEAETLLAEAKSREAAAQKAAKGGSGVARLLLIGSLLIVGYVYTRPDAPVTDVQAAAAPVAEAPVSTRQTATTMRCDERDPSNASILHNLVSGATCDDGPATSPTRQVLELRPAARPAGLVVVEAAVPAVSSAPVSNPGEDKPVSMANLICKTLDDTGLAAAPCFVETGRNPRIVATIDMAAAEARDFCPSFTRMMRDNQTYPTPGWSFHIRSPYSGDSSIAFCSF